MLNFQMSEAQAVNIHKMADTHCKTLKNHIAMYVEKGDLAQAQKLCAELREHQAIFAAFNREASHQIAAWSNKPVDNTRIVEDRSR